MSKIPVCILLVILIFACESNPSDNNHPKIERNVNELSFHLLIFKKEQKLEVWEAGNQNIFVDSFFLKNLPQLPIGQFDLSFDKKKKNLLIDFPNQFYEKKGFTNESFPQLILNEKTLPVQFFKTFENVRFSNIIIFPNDNRLAGDLNPCFACPHWMAEIYAFLNLKKNEYI